MRRGLLLAMMALLVVPLIASAQTENSSYAANTDKGIGLGLGPVIGWTKANGADGTITGGAALRMRLGPALGVEGSIMYRQDKFNSGAQTLTTWPVQVTGLIYPLPIVYGAIGVGWYHSTVDYSGQAFPVNSPSSETSTQFGWHFGGGLEIPLNGMSLFADIRYTFLNYDFKQLPGTSGSQSNFFTIGAGLLFGL